MPKYGVDEVRKRKEYGQFPERAGRFVRHFQTYAGLDPEYDQFGSMTEKKVIARALRKKVEEVDFTTLKPEDAVLAMIPKKHHDKYDWARFYGFAPEPDEPVGFS